MDDYLISKDRWEKEKTELLARAGLSEFADPRSVLKTLNKDLHQDYLRTNRAASNGSNPYLKVVGPGDFHVRTPALGDVETDPMRSIMPKRLIPLSEALATVHQHCGMLDEFKHWQQTHLRKPPTPAIAGIMGLAVRSARRKWAGFPGLSKQENWRMLSTGASPSTTSSPPMTRSFRPWIAWNCPGSTVIQRPHCTRPAMGRNSRSGSLAPSEGL